MDKSKFTGNMWGELIETNRDYLAFVPKALPPPLNLNWELVNCISEADRALAELSGLANNLPNPHLLINAFIRKEAVLSSRIEGTQASLSDLFIFESAQLKPTENSDVKEVVNYVSAMESAQRRLNDLPLSLRLIREMHSLLMQGVRGDHATPGEFRRTQNWIGPAGCTLNNAIYVPPPVPEMHSALDQFEKYIHAPSDLPALIRLALIHYQFEAIHPFIDGNGRIGRLLISLLLIHEKILVHPVLYLSAFFERNRQQYYDYLLKVSQEGDWSSWILFFLKGVKEQSIDASLRTKKLMNLWEKYRSRFGQVRSSVLLLRLIDRLFWAPIISIPAAAKLLGVTQRTAMLNIQKLEKTGVLKEITGKERHRLFVSSDILTILADDADLSIKGNPEKMY